MTIVLFALSAGFFWGSGRIEYNLRKREAARRNRYGIEVFPNFESMEQTKAVEKMAGWAANIMIYISIFFGLGWLILLAGSWNMSPTSSPPASVNSSR